MAAATAPTCSCPPGTTCIPCTTGTLEVRVYLQTVCWDTDCTLGVNSPDRPFTGVTVTVKDGSTVVSSKPTDGAGKAVFDGLNAGEVDGTGYDYQLEVSKVGFDDKTDVVDFPDPGSAPLISSTAHIDVHQTTRRMRVLRRIGLECTRKHSAPSPSGRTSVPLGPILWQDEPDILQLRDSLWLMTMFGVLVSALAGWGSAPPGAPFSAGGIAAGGICLAFFGYLGNVIFGMAFGIPAIIAAFLVFGVLIAAAIIAAVGASFLPLPPPDSVGFPALAGTWAGFLWGWLPGRRERYNCKEFVPLLTPIIAAVLGATTALVLSVVLGGGTGAVIAAVILGLIFGGVAGLLGFCFANEGKTKRNFQIADFLLPFAGQRYCVQGHRGFISHFSRRQDSGWLGWDEEPSYDWSLPEGARLLACKEGHIVGYDDSQVGNVRNSHNEEANYIAIRHFDKTTAKYLHLMTNGIAGPDWNPGLARAVTNHTVESSFDPTSVASNPLHVHAGQVIGANGDVGISMFPHLHLWVQKAPPMPSTAPDGSTIDPPADTRYVAFKFQDADTQSHEGRCWSMRKYTSSNVDKGLLVVPPDNPPFHPGGSATNGDPVPGSPLAGASGGH